MIFQTDVFLKSLLETVLQDIRDNLWLLDYILDDFTNNPLLKNKYGKKQVEAAKEWFKNNNVNVFHQFVKDKSKFPAIAIVLGTSQEAQEHRVMGDVSSDNLILLPNQVNQTIPYVVKPFIPTSVDIDNGIVIVPLEVDIAPVVAGMVLVNPENGNGVKVLGIQKNGILIEPGIDLKATQLGVIPQNRFFTTRLGKSFFQETWNIIPATTDTQSLLWLHSIIIFGLLRYREYMESNGILEITNLSSTDIFNPSISHADGEEIYARQITIQNKVQQNFIRGLHRTIESVIIRDKDSTIISPANPNGFEGGIRILSNLDTPASNRNDTNWYTINDEED